MTPLKPKPDKIKDSPFGLMNRSFANVKPPVDVAFHGEAPTVIADVPDPHLPTEKVCLLDFSRAPDTSGCVRMAETESGTPVALWRSPNNNRSAVWPTPVRDFTPYTHVEFDLYSEHATLAVFSFELRGQWKGKSPEPPHFRCVIRQNWHGWRHFAVALSSLDAAWGGDLCDVHFVGLHAVGWENDIYAVPASYIYLSSVWLTVRPSDYTPDETLVTPALLDALRERWTALVVATPDLQKEYPLVDTAVRSFSPHGKGFFDSMHRDSLDQSALWDDVADMMRGEQVQVNAERLFFIARAWAAYGTPTYRDPDLLDAVRFGLEWLWRHGYGDCRVELGTPGNWWQWAIGIPWALVKCLLVIRDCLTPAEITHFLSFADRRDPYPQMTNANRTWISYVCILSSLLQNDVPRLVECIRRMQTVFGYTDRGDGFYRDGSFIMHANKAYIGGYGTNYYLQLTDFFYVLAGTPLAIPDKYARMTMTQFFDSCVPFIYRGVMQKSVSGRGVLGDGLAVGLVASVLKLVPIATEEEKQRLYRFVRYCCDANPRFKEQLTRRLEFVTAPFYSELMAAPAAPAPAFARVYNGMDRAIAQNGDWCASLAYNTLRTCRYESINGQNETGWYQSEGSLCVSTGDPFAFDGDFYRESDPYRFPGTTVTDVERVDGCVVFLPCGTYAYGGGVDDGAFAFVGLRQGFSTHNFPWPYGFESDLDLKKAWFLFPEGVFCMASGLSCTDAARVNTTVDNRRLTPGARVTADGLPLSLRAADRRVRASRVVCPDFGAYLFDGATDLVVRKRKGERHDYFELVLPLGKKPTDLSFTYLLLPGADEAKAAAAAQNPPVTVIKNDPSVMAAQHRDGTRAFAFFEPCACDGVTTDAPLALMIRPTREGTAVIVSDPTHRQRTVSFSLEGEHRLTAPVDGVTLTVGDGRTTLTLDTNARLGVPYRFTLV